MRYAFYPGCVAKGGAPELYQAFTAVASKLGLELVEMHNAVCTGAGVLTERNPELAHSLNARNFAVAEQLGLPLMTICSTCQGVMSEAKHKLDEDPAYREKINEHLAPEGLAYSGGVSVKHFLWWLVEDLGVKRLASMVERPLVGVKLAPFYGCYILRPTWVLGINNQHRRDMYLEQVISALGAVPVDYSGRTKCCGFPIITMNEANAVSMAGEHLIEAKTNGADAMLTPCPLCHLSLDGYQPKASAAQKVQIGLPILHLPQAIGLALGMPPKALGLNRHIITTANVIAKVRA
ncbi:MAG: CoB--CoM heterodisulfide reductase iron-sulfur subunit B family protein [Chloroflexi bacterium]|nr:CoB--CoM heterodisulfide reductase iron-sulfur subunit B family protein [Chloroflexota bacterium]